MSDLFAIVRAMQSEQARQRKRERKRLEREEKRQSSRVGVPDEIDLVFEWRPIAAPDTAAQKGVRAEVDIFLPGGVADLGEDGARRFGRAPRKRIASPTRPGASS
jgi:hypothetical protein